MQTNVEHDQLLKTMAELALMHWASGDSPQRLLCETLHATEGEHALNPTGCYLSGEDAALVEQLGGELVDLVMERLADLGWRRG